MDARGRTVRVVTALWGLLAAAFAVPALAFPLALLLDEALPRGGWRALRALREWPFVVLDEGEAFFAVQMLETVMSFFSGLLGFGAVVAYPLAVFLAAAALAAGLHRGRAWAERATLVLLVLLAVGSAYYAVGPADSFRYAFGGVSPGPTSAMRFANALVAVAAGAAVWWMLPKAGSPVEEK